MRIKYNQALLNEIVKRDKCVLVGTYENVSNRETIIHFKCCNQQCGQQSSKCLRYLYKYGAFCNVCAVKQGVEKAKATFMENYGFPNPQQSPDIQAKTMETNIQRYGHANVMQNAEVRQKGQETNMERYKVKNPFQAEEFKDKSKETCKERYGFEFPTQSPEVQLKREETCMDKYGYPSHMQNPEIAERCMKASYYRKEYVFPCGKLVSVQGYEPQALDILVDDGYTSDDLIVAETEVPEIWYNKDGKSHRYYCDIFIPKENKIIEVKSSWTVTMETGNVDEKAQASKQEGFAYEIWVFDGKGNRKIVKY